MCRRLDKCDERRRQIRLNLGCGSNVLPDYINVDKNPVSDEVVEEDIVAYLVHTKDFSVDEILLQDVLEHFPHGWTADDKGDLFHTDVHPTALEVLSLVNSRLVRGGIVRIRVPDFGWLIDRWYEWKHKKKGRDENLDFKRLIWMMFGDITDLVLDTHKSMWTQVQLCGLLKALGFEDIEVTESLPNIEVKATRV
jgi:predicted SAM-dependent methyltransferase